MKTKLKMRGILSLLFICLLSLSSCHSDMDDLKVDEKTNAQELTGVKYDIMVNLIASRTGNYVKGGNSLTRGGLDVSVTLYELGCAI